MAGWLSVWVERDNPIDADRWWCALRAAERYDEAVTQHVVPGVAMAAWRRHSGEFPRSGTCVRGGRGAVLAWVGQCLDDTGDATDAALKLLAQRSPGLDAVAALNGPFAAAVLHASPRSLTIWTDRHRHYPVYLYCRSELTVASTELRCLLVWMDKPQFEPAAVDLLLRCGELVDRMTVLSDVQMLPGGTRFVINCAGRTERRYWRLQFEPDRSHSLHEWVEPLAQSLGRAVRRVEVACPRLGVPLSGGLDSRLLLGLCQVPTRVPSFTWGLPGCRDIRCAAAFAHAIDAPHQVKHWEPASFVPLWAEGVDRTAGGFGVQDMFVLPYAALLGEHCDVILNGLAGDALLGGNFLKRSWIREGDLAALADASWRWRVTPEQDKWASRLLGRAGRTKNGRRLWIESICADGGHRPIERLNQWLFENRVSRFTNCGTMLLRRAVESHAPFFDRDVVDLLACVPMEVKLKHRLFLSVLMRACPAAAHIPWQRTGISPTYGFHMTVGAMMLHKAVRLACKPLRIEPFKALAVADVPGWLRGEWAPAVEGILLSERCLDRGVFDADAVRALWRAHRGGEDCTRQLGVMLALELFAKRVLEDCR